MFCGNRNCPFIESQTECQQSSDAVWRCIVGGALQNVEFNQGEVLFLQGEPSSNLYALKHGMVKICVHTADGREQIVGLSRPGNLLLGLQSINDAYHPYTAIAVTPVHACRIKHRTLLHLVQTQGDLAMRMIAAANAQLAHSRALVEVLGQKNARAKLASFILFMRSCSVREDGGFAMPFSRMEIASVLGLSEETVCRLMANMKRSGAIHAPRGKIEIRDRSHLYAISAGDPDRYAEVSNQ